MYSSVSGHNFLHAANNVQFNELLIYYKPSFVCGVYVCTCVCVCTCACTYLLSISNIQGQHCVKSKSLKNGFYLPTLFPTSKPLLPLFYLNPTNPSKKLSILFYSMKLALEFCIDSWPPSNLARHTGTWLYWKCYFYLFKCGITIRLFTFEDIRLNTFLNVLNIYSVT